MNVTFLSGVLLSSSHQAIEADNFPSGHTSASIFLTIILENTFLYQLFPSGKDSVHLLRADERSDGRDASAFKCIKRRFFLLFISFSHSPTLLNSIGYTNFLSNVFLSPFLNISLTHPLYSIFREAKHREHPVSPCPFTIVATFRKSTITNSSVSYPWPFH